MSHLGPFRTQNLEQDDGIRLVLFGIRVSDIDFKNPFQDLTLADGIVWYLLKKYIHPTNDLLPLDTVIERCREWHDVSNPNGIESCWIKFENFILGKRNQYF